VREPAKTFQAEMFVGLSQCAETETLAWSKPTLTTWEVAVETHGTSGPVGPTFIPKTEPS